jgi:Na+/phosphate symporter
MSIEEINIDLKEEDNEQNDIVLEKPVHEYYEDDNISEDASIYENRYAHNSLEQIESKIQKRLSKINKINKRGILRKLSPHHLVKEQSKKLEEMIEYSGDIDFVIDHLESLIFYLNQLDDMSEVLRNIYVTLVELNEAKALKETKKQDEHIESE